MKKIFIRSLFTFIFSLFTSLCEAQFTDLLSFNGTNGMNPWCTIAISGNVLYGMSGNGGANNDGCIFSIHTDGSNYIDLLDFNGTNGRGPQGSLLLSGDKLYGMATSGGLYGWGNMFSIDTNGNYFKVLFNFDNTDGGTPTGTLIVSGGVLFGMTSWGGINNKGEVFSIDTSGNYFKDLLDFNLTNGEQPTGDLVLSGRTLFGMASGGGANAVGNIFSIDTTGNNFKDILDFNGTNGKSPEGSLTLSLSGTVLYGMTHSGGLKDSGCVFSIDTSGAAYKDLLDFAGINGEIPARNNLTLSGSTLYGMTNYGGTYNVGLIFAIDTDKTGYKALFDFNGYNAGYPVSSLTLSGNTFYGTTSYGGSHFDGVVFSFKDTDITTSSSQLSVVGGQLSVYPNPSEGTFTIGVKSEKLKVKNIEVFNVLGQEVKSEELRTKSEEINLTNQPNGVYFYGVVGEDGSLVGEGKLVIQK